MMLNDIFIQEKPVKCIQDISQKNAVMMLNELFSADKAPIYKVKISKKFFLYNILMLDVLRFSSEATL